MIPVLFITYNRLEYTKKALHALLHSDCGKIYIIDNCSTDGTREWLLEQHWNNERVMILINEANKGIAGAMNQFLEIVRHCSFVGKVDNDTIVPENWASMLLKKCVEHDIDIIQAKHPILSQTFAAGFDAWMKTMQPEPKDNSIFYNHFVGGSGIVFNRKKINVIPQTEWVLYGWRQFQREHPALIKAFCTDVTIDLLDTDEEGHDYSKYPEYYLTTGRLK